MVSTLERFHCTSFSQLSELKGLSLTPLIFYYNVVCNNVKGIVSVMQGCSLLRKLEGTKVSVRYINSGVSVVEGV